MEGDVGSVNTKYHQYACCSFDRIIQFQTRVICQASILSSFVLIHINFYTYIALEITLQRRRSILILVKAMNLPFQLNKCIKSIKCHLHTLKAYFQESCYAKYPYRHISYYNHLSTLTLNDKENIYRILS